MRPRPDDTAANCRCWDCRIRRAVDEGSVDLAVAFGQTVYGGGLVLVPDVCIMENLANGETVPEWAYAVQRFDGRVVVAYIDEGDAA